MRNCDFWPPHRINPLNQSSNNLAPVITLATPTPMIMLNLVQSVHREGGLVGKWVKYNQFFNYTFLWKLTYRWDPLLDFHAWWLKWRRLTQVCAFLGLCWYCTQKLEISRDGTCKYLSVIISILSLCTHLFVLSICIKLPSLLRHCWLGDRKGIRHIKNWVVGCWHGCVWAKAQICIWPRWWYYH